MFTYKISNLIPVEMKSIDLVNERTEFNITEKFITH